MQKRYKQQVLFKNYWESCKLAEIKKIKNQHLKVSTIKSPAQLTFN